MSKDLSSGSTSRRQHKPARRFLWTIVALTLIQLAALFHLLIENREWHAPEILEATILQHIEDQGFELSLNGTRVLLNGTIRCQKIGLVHAKDDRYAITADTFEAKINLWWLLMGNIRLECIAFKEVEAHYPEIYREKLKILKVSQGKFQRQWNTWHASRGFIQADPFFLTFEGAWHAIDLNTKDSDETLADTFKNSIDQLHEKRQAVGFEEAVYGTISFFETPGLANQNVAHLQIAGKGFSCNPELNFAQFRGEISFVFGNNTRPVFDAQLHINDFSYQSAFEIDGGSVTLQGYVDNLLTSVHGLHGDFQFFGFEGYRFSWGSLEGRFNLLHDLSMAMTINAFSPEEWLEWDGIFNLQTQAYTAQVSGEFSPEHVYRLPPLAEIYELHRIRFYNTPFWRLDLKFNKGFSFDSCKLFVDTRVMDLRGVPVEALSLKAEIEEGFLSVHDVHIRTKEFSVQGSYEHNMETLDYRFLLDGTIRPDAINNWMFDWWINLWERFDFHGTLPRANMDIQGRWNFPDKRFIFGSASINHCTYEGAAIERCHVNIFSAPLYLHLFNLVIDDPAGGQADIDIQWVYHPVYEEPYMLIISGEGALSLDALGKTLGPEIKNIVKPFNTPSAPSLKVEGVIFGEDSPLKGKDRIDVSASIPSPLTYYGVPIDWLSLTAERRYGYTRIEDLEFGLAKGHTSGHVHINTFTEPERLTFNLQLKDAIYADFMKVLPTLKNLSSDEPLITKDEENSTKPKESAPGVINVEISGKGNLGHLDSFDMLGNAHLREASLGKLSLFGPLSDVLELTFLKISKLELRELKTNYSIAHNTLSLTDLKITGPTAKMEGKGLYDIEEDQLNLTFSVYLLGGIKIPIVSQVLSLIDPVSKIFKVRLTGNFDEPQWSMGLHPFGMIQQLLPEQKVKKDSTEKVQRKAKT